MNKTARNVIYSPLWLLLHLASLLPLRALYPLSDILCFILCRVARYRKALVEDNIACSFPEKSEAEREKIKREFYRNFTDVFVETIKLLHISDKQMRRRVVFEGCDWIDRHTAEGKSVGLYCSHFGNWEWITSITLWFKDTSKVNHSQVYRPLRNRWFDHFYYHIRRRFGSESIPKNGVLRHLLADRREGAAFVTGFISDQKPSHNDGRHHVCFLGQDTPFITGTELLLRKLKAAACYADMERVGRGRYRVRVIPITDDVSLCAENETTDRYARLLEASILRQPAAWLWSHNRWRKQIR